MASNDEDMKVAKKLCNIASSASKRGKEFSLTLADVRRLLRKKCCEYTGVQMTEAEGGVVPPKFTDRTFDRIDPSVGYHPHNVVAICHGANQLKEILLESKFGTSPNALACSFDFLKSFVKGVEKSGYKE